MTVLVYGLAVAGRAAARELAAGGERVALVDDSPDSSHAAFAAEIGATLIAPPGADGHAALLRDATLLVPSPGLPETHPVFAAAARLGVRVEGELEVAYRLEAATGAPRPMLGVTGTDGKTTTVRMATAILRHAGLRAEAVGNTEVPLLAALRGDAQAFVVECSSFRLAHVHDFRTEASVWLNFAADHLDWHGSMETYRAAKARMWRRARTTDVLVAPTADPSILADARASGGRVVTFGPAGDYREEAGALRGPAGEIVRVADLPRALPHDLSDGLAAAAIAIESGLATPAHAAAALAAYEHAPHRIQLVAEHGGVRWYDDSKATTPHAARTAIGAFASVVLIAGGRNKGLDLSPLVREVARLRGVVAIGEAAGEVEAAFAHRVEVVQATSMRDAVEAAWRMAREGDAVLLSPACASYDWYRNYGERGDDFARSVRERLAAVAAGRQP
jgi:UDP-N-acetylmuramoylalanine--D-glutamate ligase